MLSKHVDVTKYVCLIEGHSLNDADFMDKKLETRLVNWILKEPTDLKYVIEITQVQK